jgi:hypothetical protein
MARKNDPGSGATYEAGSTAGASLEGVMAGEAGLNLDLARLLAAQGGHPGMRDPNAKPFGKGSGSADLPSGGNTWAAPSGAG